MGLEYSWSEILEEIATSDAEADMVLAVIGIYLAILGVALLLSLVLYVFQSIGLHKMGRTCQVQNAWLAWLPIGNLYVIGALAQCDNRVCGKKGLPYRVLLPVGGAVTICTSIATVVLMLSLIGQVVIAELSSNGYLEDTAVGFGLALGPLVMLTLLLMVVSVATAVLEYIALYRIFHLFDRQNATLYIILSIFVTVSLPIILFILRNRQPGAPAPQPPAWNPPNFYQPPAAPYTPAPPQNPAE